MNSIKIATCDTWQDINKHGAYILVNVHSQHCQNNIKQRTTVKHIQTLPYFKNIKFTSYA